MTALTVDLEGIEPRVARALEVILRVVGGDLGARAQASDRRDSLDAVVVGLNMMAETLERERSAREKAEALLSDAIDTYDNAPDFFCSCDAESLAIVKCNEPMARALGTEVRALLGRSLLELFQPGSREALRGALERLAQGGAQRAVEVTLETPDPRVVSVSGSVMRDARGAPGRFRLVLRDVTEARQLEDQLVHAQRMEAIGRLAGGVAHDFNNLLLVIMGAVDLLEKRLDEQQRKDLLVLREAADRAALLTRDLLVFARRERGRPRAVDIDETLGRVRSVLERLAGKSVAFELECATAGAKVQFDPSRLEQVLVNLVVNSRDAMPNGGRVVVAARLLDTDEALLRAHPDVTPGRYVELRVADTGEGIPAELGERVFDPFFTTKPTGKGTGLGLSTVYGLVRQVGGYVWFQSEAGRGTTFSVLLPVVDGAYAEPPPLPRPSDGRNTVLVVEDDDRVRAVTCRILREVGFQVLEAANGLAAIEVFQRAGAGLSLVVSDVLMPEMNGPDAVAAMRRSRPDLRCVYVTGFAHDRQELLAHEDATVLSKPFLPAALLACVREELER